MPQKMVMAMAILGGQSNLLIRLFSLSFTHFCAFAYLRICVVFYFESKHKLVKLVKI